MTKVERKRKINSDKDENEERYYWYFYIDPTRNFFIFYIGSGTEDRAFKHLKDVKAGRPPNKTNYKFHNQIKAILNKGLEPEIIISPLMTEVEARYWELKLYNMYLKTGNLTNMAIPSAPPSSKITLKDFLALPEIVKTAPNYWVVIFNSKDYSPDNPHSLASIRNNIIGFKEDIVLQRKYCHSIKKMQPGDVVFLQDTVPTSGVCAVGVLTSDLYYQDTKLWNDDLKQELFPYRFDVNWVTTKIKQPFPNLNKLMAITQRSLAEIKNTEVLETLKQYFEIKDKDLTLPKSQVITITLEAIETELQ